MPVTTDPLAGLDTSGLGPLARRCVELVALGYPRQHMLVRHTRMSRSYVAVQQLAIISWCGVERWDDVPARVREMIEATRESNAQTV